MVKWEGYGIKQIITMCLLVKFNPKAFIGPRFWNQLPVGIEWRFPSRSTKV